MKPKVETNREMGTMKIDDIEFNEKQVKALNHLLEAFEKKITNQVCEEIRNSIETSGWNLDDYEDRYVYAEDLEELLDQIEGGEK